MKQSKLVTLPPALTIAGFIEYCLKAIEVKKDPTKKAKRRRMFDNRFLNSLTILNRLLNKTQFRIIESEKVNNGFGLKITGRELAYLSTDIIELLICSDESEVVCKQNAYFYLDIGSSKKELEKTRDSEFGKFTIKNVIFYFEA